jgi:23S rRNA (uracil1939-C5)-methyltransferase
MLRPRDRVTLVIEKPAAGGWMIARHEGQVVLVAGTIPGERVVADITRAERSVAYATAIDILEPDGDRRPWPGDWTCGGASYAFINYPRQLVLKSEIIADAFARIGRMPLDAPVDVTASDERGYRMRARLHVLDGRIGFFREATHELCDPASTGQLAVETCAVLDHVRLRLKKLGVPQVSAIELAENAPLTERVLHLQLRPAPGLKTSAFASLAGTRGITGLTCAMSTGAATVRLGGEPFVHDTVSGATLRRHVRSFFQGNRYLLQTLADAVRDAVTADPRDPILDLYSGVGLFAVALAARGWGQIVAVEGDRSSADDLAENARPFDGRIVVLGQSVEDSLTGYQGQAAASIILDPPRTGLSREALEAVVRHGARQLVYVSCDVATLARDVRRLVDSGYALDTLRAFDLFPNTPHIETLVTFTRTRSSRRL